MCGQLREGHSSPEGAERDKALVGTCWRQQVGGRGDEVREASADLQSGRAPPLATVDVLRVMGNRGEF